MSRAVDEYNDEIRSIQNEPLPADQTEAKKSWEASIEEINRDINSNIEEKKNLEGIIKDSRRGLEPVEEEIAELRRKLDEKAKEIVGNEAQLQKYGSYSEKLKLKQTQVLEAIANVNQVLISKQAELKEKKAANDQKISALEAEGQVRVPISNKETPSFLQAQANQLQKIIEQNVCETLF